MEAVAEGKGKGKGAGKEAAWGVPWREVQPASAYVPNAARGTRTNVAYPATGKHVQSADP